MIDEIIQAGLLGEAEAVRFMQLGHFAYEGGEHGDTLLALELLSTDPIRMREAGARLAAAVQSRGVDAECVCGPLIGGALVGQWVAHALGASFVYGELEPPRRYMITGEQRAVVAGRRVLIVDDVVNAGSAALACAAEIEALGGRVVGVAALMMRATAGARIAARLGGVIAETLVTVDWNAWPARDCPLCASGVELVRAR